MLLTSFWHFIDYFVQNSYASVGKNLLTVTNKKTRVPSAFNRLMGFIYNISISIEGVMMRVAYNYRKSRATSHFFYINVFSSKYGIESSNKIYIKKIRILLKKASKV